MTTLSEFLGALMTELTLARVNADIAAVRVAQLYGQSTLLEGAPVPRFRLPELTLDVPMAIDAVSSTSDALSRRYAAPALEPLVDRALAEARIPLDDAQRAQLRDAASGAIKEHWSKSLRLDAALAATLNLPSAVAETLSKLRWSPDPTPPASAESDAERALRVSTFQRSLNAQLQQAVVGTQRDGPRIEVLTRTSQLRELKDAGMLVRMNLTLREDGFELVKIERADGTSSERLIPE